jgi:hypothetical protein
VVDMPGFDPEATAPVRRPCADSRSDRPYRSDASRVSPAAADPMSTRLVSASTGGADPAGAPQAPAATPPAPEPALLPDITTDERDVGWGDLPEPADDDHYLRDVPPHHGS